ncbi:MurR/RpiR family transcriptional regulator [Paenibacillus sp. alder61]|uniref:MurR/RpiR family transcriptional regulator n=1 Tax=Paenibacillus faecis TaxID=862114 RepID=A0A5D0CQ85_9BACL|nr:MULTISPECIES: MurR/RpiR family transcriptional regulator [Paenibacillus]MCA1296086.1 MurR/RpiR family transcriptional regulator [Paenibacillus sp. alder61]TYA10907.1 MurR/RpiR family transcriptional regulator [Paenibacillus faecis]
MQTPILHALSSHLETLPPQERRLGEYILKSPASVIHLGITELAYTCGISPSTVTRFCKTFHFKGFPDFKMKLAGELAHQPSQTQYQDVIAGNDLHKIVQAMEANHLASITDTTRLLDMNELRRAVDALCKAGRIDLYGVATSSIIAQDFYQKLVRIGKHATAFADSHMQITSASSLGSGDVAFAVSYGGETPETIDALRCAKDSGALTISLTQYGSNTLASLADISLFSSSLEEGMRRGDMASRIAQLHVIDILFTGMVSMEFEHFIPKLETSYQNVQIYRKQREGNSHA